MTVRVWVSSLGVFFSAHVNKLTGFSVQRVSLTIKYKFLSTFMKQKLELNNVQAFILTTYIGNRIAMSYIWLWEDWLQI